MDLQDRLTKLEADFAAWKEEEAQRAEARREAFATLVCAVKERDEHVSSVFPQEVIDNFLQSERMFIDFLERFLKSIAEYARSEKREAFADEMMRIMAT